MALVRFLENHNGRVVLSVSKGEAGKYAPLASRHDNLTLLIRSLGV